MSNIIISPQSGIIEFNTGAASGSSFFPSDAPIRLEGSGVGVISADSGIFASGMTIGGNPVMTGANPFDEDTLQTVTDRGATTTNSIHLDSDSAQLQFGDANNMQIFHNSAKGEINVAAGDFEIDSAGDIILDADGGDILIKDGGTQIGQISKDISSSNFVIKSSVSDADLEFKGVDGGANITAMIIDMSEGGKVGIGVTNPVKELQVDGSILGKNNGGFLQYDFQGNVATVLNLTTANELSIGQAAHVDSMSFNVGGTDDAMFIDSSANVCIGNSSAAAKLDIRTDNGNSIRCESSTGSFFTVQHGGKVGIQTNSPTYALHIDNNGNNNAANILIDSTTLHDSSISFSHNGTFGFTIGTDESDSKKFKISSGDALGTNDRFTIDVQGNVGIGLTDPDQKLHVSDNVRIGDGGASDYNRLEFTRYGGAIVGGIGWHTDAHFYVGGHPSVGPTAGNTVRVYGFGGDVRLGDSVNGDVLTVDATNGRVGIGTINPAVKLDVVGDAQLQGAAPRLVMKETGSSKDFSLKVQTDGRFSVLNDNLASEVLTIKQDGDVGIGLNTPTSKLHIFGGDNTGLAGSLRNDAKNRMNMKVAMSSTTRYIGTVTQYGNGDSAGFTIRIYDGAEKVFRIVRVVVQNSGGTNFPSITVEGGGEDTDIHIDLKYKNRDGDATKTDFFLDPTGAKFFTQYIEIEGFIFKEEGYNTTSLSSCSLDDDLALSVLDHGNGSRVGIGTNSPVLPLHVEGSVLIDAYNQTSAGGEGIFFRQGFTSSNKYNLSILTHNDGDGSPDALDINAFDGINFCVGSNSRNPKVVITSAGHVGIGTIAAAYPLVVRTAGDGIKLDVTDGVDANFRVNVNGAVTEVGPSTANFALMAGGAERVRIDAGGVGIGTTNPSQKLEIKADATALADQPAEPLFVHNGGNNIDGRVFLSVKHDRISTAQALGAGLKMTAGAVTAGTASYFDSLIFLEGAAAGSDTIHSAPKAIKFYVDNHDSAAGTGNLYYDVGDLALTIAEDRTFEFKFTNSTVQLFENANDDVRIGTNTADAFHVMTNGSRRITALAGGNVGIGTTSPSVPLEVVGDIFAHNGPAGGRSLVLKRAGASKPWKLTQGHTSTNDLEVLEEHDTRLIIKAGGNVGIGTNNPQAKLHVDGDVIIDTDTTNKALYVTRLGSTSESLKINVDDASAKFEVIQDENSAAHGNFHFQTDINDDETYYRFDVGGSEVMRLTATGLEIKGNQSTDHPRIHFQASDNSNRFTIETDLDTTTSNDTLGFVSNFGTAFKKDILFLKSNGNVGIGTNNAGTKLHVRSSAADCVLRLQAADSTTHNSTISFGDNDANGIGSIKYAHNGDSMRFTTAGVEAVRIDSSQRVGIGTDSILGMLQLNGRALVESPSVPTTLTISDSGDATKAIRIGYEPTWDAGSISASDFGAGWKDIIIAPYGGNVGIGTTDPAAKLDVNGDFGVSAIAYLNGDVRVGGDQITFTNDSASAFIQGADTLYIESDFDNDDSQNKPIIFRTSAVERVRIAGNGNVGIGTNTAPQKLTVKGGITHTNSSNIQVVTMTNSSEHGRLIVNQAAGVTRVLLNSNGDSYFNGGYVGIGTTNPTTKLEVSGSVSNSLAAFRQGSDGIELTTRSSNGRQQIDFLGTNTSAINAKGSLFINYDTDNNGSNDNITFARNNDDEDGTVDMVIKEGKVGVGTASPDYTLTVDAGATNEIARFRSTDNDALISITDNTDTVYIGHDASADIMCLGFSNTVGSTTNLNIDTGGSVGIGTNNPDQKLHIKGTAIRFEEAGGSIRHFDIIPATAGVNHKFTSDSTSAGYEFHNNTNYLASFENTMATFNPSAADIDFKVRASSSTDAIFVRGSDGHVGIGTNNPSQELTISTKSASANNATLHLEVAGTNVEGFINQNNGEMQFISRENTTNGTFKFQGSNGSAFTNYMVIDADGDVGIGTNSPVSITSTVSSLTLNGTNATVGGGIVYQVNGTAKAFHYVESNLLRHQAQAGIGHQFFANAVERMRIQSDGNVGIGVTNPAEKLEVAGNILAKDAGVLAGVGGDKDGFIFHDLFTAGGNYYGYKAFSGPARLSIVTDGSERLTVDANGRVGVAVTSPDTDLHIIGPNNVNGGITLSTSSSDSTNKVGRIKTTHYNTSEEPVTMLLSNNQSSSNIITIGGGSTVENAATLLKFKTAANNTTLDGTERMRITSAGNVGIGVTGDPSDKLEVNGSFSASSKTFNIEHPTKSGKRLIHGCFEGPEHGVYFRGKTQDRCIQAPEYWSALVDIDSMTVDVTPIGPNQSIYVDRIEDNGDIYVGANTDEPLNYFYIVYGERKDIDKLEIVKDAPVASPNQVVD